MEVIVKTTTACNGSCIYCSARSPTSPGHTVDSNRLPEFFSFFSPWVAASEENYLRFTWHGGEPLLAGKEFYREVARVQKQVFGTALVRVANKMQSNLTLVDEEWARVLGEFLGRGPIGSSIDIVDGIRGLKSGAGLMSSWINGQRLLHAQGIDRGVVYVVHRQSLGRVRDLYYFFKNLDPGLGVRFNPIYRDGMACDPEAAPLNITARQYGQFLVELFEIWLRDGLRGGVSPLDEIHRAWMGDTRFLCCDYGGRCHQTHLGIEPGGGIFSCGRGCDLGRNQLGNVYTSQIADIIGHDYFKAVAGRQQQLPSRECADCSHWEICHGGCPIDALLYEDRLEAPTWFCESRKMIFAAFEREFGPPVPAPVLPLAATAASR